MATLSTLLTQVRRDLHDLTKPQEQTVDIDSTLRTYPFPTLGPIGTGSMTLDIDGAVQAAGTYTLFESGFVQFPSPITGARLHAVYSWSRYSDEDLTQYIQEAIREYSIAQPKRNTRRRTAQNTITAHLAQDYHPGDASFVIDSTAGYDPRGIVQVGLALYLYTSTDATHFNGISVWQGPDAIQLNGSLCTQNDNTNHGWFFDPAVVRTVEKLEGYEPADAYGIGSGFNDIAYYEYDTVNGFIHLEFDFGNMDSGYTEGSIPTDQFQVTTGEFYSVPNVGTDTLDVPDFSLNPISWLAAALAAEAREGDRDASWREQAGADTTADPTLTYEKVGAANRKKWEEWVKQQFTYPVYHRRMYRL